MFLFQASNLAFDTRIELVRSERNAFILARRGYARSRLLLGLGIPAAMRAL
jgi:hypothetical protein